jgi:PTS system mannitol-specific IIC component
VKKAGLNINVTNKAISNLTDDANTLVVTQEELADRAATMAPSSTRVAVSNFLNSPKYDEIISNLTGATTQAPTQTQVAGNEIDLNTIDGIVFAHDNEHQGSATMGKTTLQAIFDRAHVTTPIYEAEFTTLDFYNNNNIVIVTTKDFTPTAKQYAPNAQHLSVDSLITTPEYDKMIARMVK